MLGVNAIFTHPNNLKLLDAEFLPHSIKLLPVCLSILGAVSSYILYSSFVETLYAWKVKNSLGKSLYTFLNGKWFFDKVYTEFVVQSSLHHGYHTTYKLVDRGIIELLGPHGISQVLYLKSRNLSRFQTGHLFHYTLLMILGIFIGLSSIILGDFHDFFANWTKFIMLFAILTLILKGRQGNAILSFFLASLYTSLT
jgi:NADH-ubiquinone oxidoreductase chain 5